MDIISDSAISTPHPTGTSMNMWSAFAPISLGKLQYVLYLINVPSRDGRVYLELDAR